MIVRHTTFASIEHCNSPTISRCSIISDKEERMALFDNGLKIGTGLAIGIGALIIIPAVVPAVATILRPIVKATIKSGLVLVEKTMELAAEAKESMEDMAAEAHAELAQERQGTTSSPVSGTEADANVY
jgi:hypothetical protein